MRGRRPDDDLGVGQIGNGDISLSCREFFHRAAAGCHPHDLDADLTCSRNVELGVDVDPSHRLPDVYIELACAI